jgi:hypothetical protein
VLVAQVAKHWLRTLPPALLPALLPALPLRAENFRTLPDCVLTVASPAVTQSTIIDISPHCCIVAMVQAALALCCVKEELLMHVPSHTLSR